MEAIKAIEKYMRDGTSIKCLMTGTVLRVQTSDTEFQDFRVTRETADEISRRWPQLNLTVFNNAGLA